MSLNKEILLTGNVGRIESKYTDTGKLLCNFSLAVSVGRGENKSTEWYDCVAWEKTAEILSEYVGKGSKLQVRGDFELQLWKAKETGEPKGKIAVTVKEFQFLSPKKAEAEHSEDEPAFMQD
jgi:single-strand DNA-binding protein